MALEEKDYVVFELIKERCLDVFDSARAENVMTLAEELMDMPEIPMHYPFHHYIVPAALLTVIAAERGDSRERLSDMLETAKGRAALVPGGACGNMGNCGACVGAGICMSVYTDSTPMSEKTWSWANELTGRCLIHLSSVEGPRCCKRACFMVLQEAVPFINEKLGTRLVINENQICKYYENNVQCRKNGCPFYPVQK